MEENATELLKESSVGEMRTIGPVEKSESIEALLHKD